MIKLRSRAPCADKQYGAEYPIAFRANNEFVTHGAGYHLLDGYSFHVSSWPSTVSGSGLADW